MKSKQTRRPGHLAGLGEMINSHKSSQKKRAGEYCWAGRILLGCENTAGLGEYCWAGRILLGAKKELISMLLIDTKNLRI
jgi:hypothetical protein